MKSQVLFIVCAVLVADLVVGCGGQPATGHVGPVGPPGPVGPQSLEDTLPPNRPTVTVIEDTNVMVNKEYSFSGFTQVEISDGFDVIITRGDDFQVSTKFEETAVPYIEMEQAGDVLKIQLEDDRTYHMVNITLDIEVTMPELTRLVLEDGSDATVSGFGDEFETEIDFLSELHRE